MNDAQLYAMAEEEVRKLINKQMLSDCPKLCEMEVSVPYDLKDAFRYYVEKILNNQGYSIIKRCGPYVSIAKVSA